jgi:SAM-dependent methyltransferase/4-amino-4-deoxy-L-arabinose transferase-like glycosyltransferase
MPAFRALLRAVEARFVNAIPLAEPVLDLGCGDGHFAQMILAKYELVGVDPWWGPLNKARNNGVYSLVVQSLGDMLPFSDGHFASVVSNSVLEHIQDVQEVLLEANRVLRVNGRLVITVPSQHFASWLGVASSLDRLGLHLAADGYRKVFNTISRHVHTDSPTVWASRLADAGFCVDRWQYYFSEKALRALELGHFQGLPSALLHFVTGHWIVAPWEGNLRRTERWVRPLYSEVPDGPGAYILMVARKESTVPARCDLPAASPFTQQELRLPDATLELESALLPTGKGAPLITEDHMSAPGMVSTVRSPAEPLSKVEIPEEREVTPVPGFPYVSASLVFLALLFAAIGQVILSNQPPEPNVGVRWYLYSLGLLLLFLWRQKPFWRPRLPNWQIVRPASISRRRWLYLLAILIALVAQGVANNSGGETRAGFALFLWLVAAAVAFYALDAQGSAPLPGISRFGLGASLLLFLVALVFRSVNLAEHPYIINGVEASIGLEALGAVTAGRASPFATGWLTNPTLPLFLLGIPLKLLGPSSLSIRLLSPLVGALTVVLTFLIGSRLYGKSIGLTAAIMLAGSHFHLHYSRLGMTNIWDPLLVLVGLGAINISWREHEENNRRRWMLAGVAIGLAAYFFTSSHLLPLMLGALLLHILIFDRKTLGRNRRHILSALLMALIVALPQLIYYLDNPSLFMDRANSLGILEQQSGWLAREAASRGQSQLALLGEQLWQASLAFNYQLDTSSAYRPQSPLMGFGPAILFVFGLLLAAMRFRQLRYSMLLVWIGVTVIFAGALLVEVPSSHRLIIAAPALYLLAAIALVELGSRVADMLSYSLPGRRPAPAPSAYLLPVLAVLCALFTLNDVLFYFGRYQSQHSFGDRNTEIADRMAKYLNSLDDGWTVYFYGPPSMYVDFPTIPFLATDFQRGLNLFDVIEPFSELPLATTPRVTHIFLPERGAEIEPTRAAYPEGRLREFSGYFADPSFYAYEVER